MEKDRLEIAKLVQYYVSIILKEYKDLIPVNIKNRLLNTSNFLDYVKIENTNTISLFVTMDDLVIHLPLDAYKVINNLKELKEYGSNKYNCTHDKTNMVINNNTFIDFVNHIIVSGSTPLDYFKEVLLHEVMHVCGSDGGSSLQEGFNELKTREIALKYNLYTSCCGYPKEVKIAYELELLFGKEICDQFCFLSFPERLELLDKKIGVYARELYLNIYLEMEKEFRPYMDRNYSGLIGIKEKCDTYEKIDYSNVYKLIKQYNKEKIV